MWSPVAWGHAGADLSDNLLLPPRSNRPDLRADGRARWLIITPWITTYPARIGRRALLRTPVESLVVGIAGLLVGLLAAALFAWPLSLLPDPFGWLLPIVFAFALAYSLTTIAALRGHIFWRVRATWAGSAPCTARRCCLKQRRDPARHQRDHRCRTSISAKRVSCRDACSCPLFVLHEAATRRGLSGLAARNGGKRGLEILSELKQVSASPGGESSAPHFPQGVDARSTRSSNQPLLFRQRGAHGD